MCRKKTKIYTAEIYGQPQEGGIGGQAAQAMYDVEMKEPLWISGTLWQFKKKWWQFWKRPPKVKTTPGLIIDEKTD